MFVILRTFQGRCYHLNLTEERAASEKSRAKRWQSQRSSCWTFRPCFSHSHTALQKSVMPNGKADPAEAKSSGISISLPVYSASIEHSSTNRQ